VIRAASNGPDLRWRTAFARGHPGWVVAGLDGSWAASGRRGQATTLSNV